MPEALQAPLPAPEADPVLPPTLSRRERCEQRRLHFLRRFRAGGEVKLAAEQAGIAHATLYRWRTQDEAFRARWDSAADQRRFELEDLMMQVAREGVRTAVFHKGEEVGCRVDRLKPVVAMMAYLDRREGKRLETEKKQLLESHFSTAQSGGKPPFFGVSGVNDFIDDLDLQSSDDWYENEDDDSEEEAALMAAERDAEVAWDNAVARADAAARDAAAREAERQDEIEEEAEAREDRESREARELAREAAQEANRQARAAEAQSAQETRQGPDAGTVKPVDRKLLVRIVQPFRGSNGILHHPGAIIEIRDEQDYMSQYMERLNPSERAAPSAIPPASYAL